MRFGKASVSPPVARALRARGFGFITDGIDKLKETAGDVIDMVTEGTENVVDTITEETGDIVDEITEETGEIVDDITEGTENIVDDVTQGAGEVIGNIQDGGENVVDKIQEGGENVVEGIANIGDTDISESITIPVSLGKENEETLLFEDLTTYVLRPNFSLATYTNMSPQTPTQAEGFLRKLLRRRQI
jgi:methyl-accepting chemotaxis protein